MCLGTVSVDDSHTGETISKTLAEVFDKWNIGKERRCIMFMDNHAATAKATELMKIASEPCLIHTIQLVVNDGLKDSVQSQTL